MNSKILQQKSQTKRIQCRRLCSKEGYNSYLRPCRRQDGANMGGLIQGAEESLRRSIQFTSSTCETIVETMECQSLQEILSVMLNIIYIFFMHFHVLFDIIRIKNSNSFKHRHTLGQMTVANLLFHRRPTKDQNK